MRFRLPASEPGELGGESLIGCGCGVTDGGVLTTTAAAPGCASYPNFRPPNEFAGVLLPLLYGLSGVLEVEGGGVSFNCDRDFLCETFGLTNGATASLVLVVVLVVRVGAMEETEFVAVIIVVVVVVVVLTVTVQFGSFVCRLWLVGLFSVIGIVLVLAAAEAEKVAGVAVDEVEASVDAISRRFLLLRVFGLTSTVD